MKSPFPCLCKAILWLRCPHFYPFSLPFQPLYATICIILSCKVNGVTTPLDADYTAI
ncbi:hypothetical protein HMPREF0971_01822 [Segatella oris F0302]|uniref:Uncharacterized protein n=1 Tax=Segatella oris F0302 TaxID=649760 RepID=D1QS66_9BACT|nr:hypothetical protein HMPREF0971_01822 [Segatella oris F0302]